MVQEQKKLYRTRKNRIFGGVLGGMGLYFGVDPTLVRVIFALLLVMTGFAPFGVLYLILWLIIPEAPAKTEDISDEELKSLENSRSGMRVLLVFLAIIFLIGFFLMVITAPLRWMFMSP